jgi:hypothetical protein
MAKKVLTDQEEHPENYFTTSVGHIRDRIIIHESMDIPKEGMFVALNGFPFLIKPGVEVDIPRPVRLMLDTRIKTETIPVEGGKDLHRNIPRITYTLVKEGVNLPENIPVPEVISAVVQEPPSLESP